MKNILNIILLITLPFVASCSTPKKDTVTDINQSTTLNTKPAPTVEETKEIVQNENASILESALEEKVIEKEVEKSEVKEVKIIVDKKIKKEVFKSKETSSTTKKVKTTPEAKKEVKEEVKALTPIVPNHQAWDDLTSKYINEAGNVNYDGLKGQHSKIKSYITELKNQSPKSDWKRNEKLAYWINLYNALTVNLILDNYPVKSIMEINKGKAWDLKVIEIDGKSYSLNDIEHGTIRKQFNEPRIHFAVNCAAASCPKLMNGAFFPNKLEGQLESLSKYFVNNTNKNKISGNATQLSQIFNWYGGDFGDVKAFIKKYHKDFNESAPLTYLEYDWKLNK